MLYHFRVIWRRIIVTLKSGFIEGYSNWYHSKAWMWFPIFAFHIVTTACMAVSLTVYEIFSERRSRASPWNSVMGCSMSLKMAPFSRPYTLNNIVTLKSGLKIIQTGTIRKLGCGFLFAFHSNYGSTLHHFRDNASCWSKIVIFSYPLAFDAPVRGLPVGL